MATPELIFICGCNGAGKSTLIRSTRMLNRGEVLIDPDLIAREQGLNLIAAGRVVAEQVKDMLERKHSFVKESTMTSNFDFATVTKAKDAGFTTSLIYIGLNSPEPACLRVQSRFQAGGHNVPVADIRRRYGRSLENLVKAVALFDRVVVFDNSGPTYREVACFHEGKPLRKVFIPDWFRQIATDLKW